MKMKHLVLIGFMANSLLISCTGRLDVGSELSSAPISGNPGSGNQDGEDGGGGNDDGGSNPTPPQIHMVNLKGGEYVAGGQIFKIYFTVEDQSLGFNQSKIEYKRDGDTEWKVIRDRVSTVSGLEAVVDWPVCPQTDNPDCTNFIEGNGYRIRITSQGRNDLISSEVSAGTFTIDATPPTLTESGFTSAPGFPLNGFTKLRLEGVSDTATPIKDVCVKMADTTPPLPGDTCWVSIEAYGVQASLTPDPIDIIQYVGFFSGNYSFSVWARDSAGNTTTYTQNNAAVPTVIRLKNIGSGLCLGMPGVNTASGALFPFNTCNDAVDQDFEVSYTSTGRYLLKNMNSQFCLDDSSTIANQQTARQIACNAGNANQHFFIIERGPNRYSLLNKGNNCMTPAANSTATDAKLVQATCNPSADIQAYEIEVRSGGIYPDATGLATKMKDQLTLAYTAPASSPTEGFWNDSVNTDFAFQTDATATATQQYINAPANDLTTRADPGSFVVTSKGQVIVRDKNLGLVRLDMVTRSREILIPIDSAFQEGYTGGTPPSDPMIPQGKLKNPLRIAVDEDDWIWIQDEEHIAYIDSTGLLKIAAGGGSDTNDVIANPLNAQISYHENMRWYGSFKVFPGKLVIFNSENPVTKLNPATGSRYRLRILNLKENHLSSLALSGSFGSTPTEVKDFVPYGTLNFTYNSDRKFIDKIFGRFCTAEIPDSANLRCDSQVMLEFNSRGEASAQISNHSNFSNLTLISSLDGIYAFNAQRGFLSQLDLNTRTWSKILGGSSRASSYCNNNTSSTSCDLRLVDVFVTNQKRIFFMDQSRIRSVELNGRIQTPYEP